MTAKITLTGDKELINKLYKLEAKIGKKIGRKALRAGAKIIAKEVKASAPVAEKGLIPPAVKVKAGKRSRRKIQVNAQIGDKDWTGSTFYAAFVEFGTSKMPPLHFTEKAAERKRAQAQEAIENELRKGIEAEAKKK